ncbi:MAG: ribonuclease III [Bradymonadaceae bacterium]
MSAIPEAGGGEPDERRVGRDELERTIGYEFDDPTPLVRALTHTSFRAETSGVDADNQRLEYLGDAVVGCVVADMLYRRYPEVDEGRLSIWRSRLVRRSALADAARRIDLGDHLRLGKAELQTGGRQRDSVLADAYEALLAAVYLDGGYDAARRVVEDLHAEGVERVSEAGGLDFKSELQKLTQAESGERPSYEIVDEQGPPHDKSFAAEVSVGGDVRGCGVGSSKQDAEQDAAAEALESLDRS